MLKNIASPPMPATSSSSVQLKSGSLMPLLGKSLSSIKSREKDISRTIVSKIVPVFPCMLASDTSNNFEVVCWEFVNAISRPDSLIWERRGAQPHVIAYYRVFLFSEAIINTSEGSTQAKPAKRECVFSGSRQTTSYLRPIHWCGPSRRRLLSIYSLETSIFLTFKEGKWTHLANAEYLRVGIEQERH